MSTTDIIPGMTEVMDYIKKQDEEIKKLKEENGEIMDSLDKELGVERNLARDVRILVEENEELKTSIQTTTSYWTDHNGLLLEEKKKLQEEIEELKEHLECEEDGYPTSDWFVDKLDFHIKYHFLNEGGEYYEALKDLKEKPNCLDDLIYGSLERLQEELKEKEETFKYQSDMEKQCHNDDIDKKQQVIDELKEENKALKEENEELKEEVEERTTYSVLPEEGKFMEENKKLKEENKKLKKGNETYEDLLAGEKGLIDEINKLKEEKDGYFQAWLYYWSGGSQGKEHKIPMSEIEDGKYQEMKEFLERHNITENDLEQLVKESADYDLPK